MATKRTPTKTTPAKSKNPATFTLRQIEAKAPCWDGYEDALKKLKSHPIPGGHFDPGGTKPRKSLYGPDDPISLADVADKLDAYHLRWLVEVVIPNPLRSALRKAADEIEENAMRFAIKNTLPRGKTHV